MDNVKSSKFNYFSLLGFICIIIALPLEALALFKFYSYVSEKTPVFWVCLPVIIIMGCCFALSIIVLAKLFDLKKLWKVSLTSFAALLISICVGIASLESNGVQMDMQGKTADEYYGFSQYMEFSNLSFDSVFYTLSNSSAKEYVTGYNGEEKTVWEYLDYDKLLGTTSAEAEKSFNEAKVLSAYEYTFDYRNLHKITTLWLIQNPSKTFSNISILKKYSWQLTLSKTSYALPFAVKTSSELVCVLVLPEIAALLILRKMNKNNRKIKNDA